MLEVETAEVAFFMEADAEAKVVKAKLMEAEVEAVKKKGKRKRKW